jgi:hypothetical protein
MFSRKRVKFCNWVINEPRNLFSITLCACRIKYGQWNYQQGILASHRYPDVNPCDIVGGGDKIYFVCQHSTCSGSSIIECSLSNVNCKKYPEICLKEFRHISQQRAEILDTYYDEYKNNYYI